MTNSEVKEIIYRTITEFLSFPTPSVCVHYASLTLIDEVIRKGIEIDKELIDCICKNSAGDERTLEILKEKINN